MSIWKFSFVLLFIAFSSISHSQMPSCLKYGNQVQEVSIDKKSGLIVFFDQTVYESSKFQVWDLKKSKKITEGELPDKYYYILGFVNSQTIAFARSYDPYYDKVTFSPIVHFHIDTGLIDQIPVKANTLRVTAFSLAANLAVGYGNWGKYSVNLKTGELSEIPPETESWVHFQSGFSQDGMNYFSVAKVNKEYDTRRLSILKRTGPQFFEQDPEVITFVEPEDVGLKNVDDYMYEGHRSVSESGNSFALTLSIYNQTPQGEKQFRKLMWLDLWTGEKTFCDVDHEGIPNVQIIDEKSKTLLLQSDASFYHYRKIVNMETCNTTSLTQMKGVSEIRSGYLFKYSNRNLYYNTGGVWDLQSGEILLRSCE